MSSFNSDLAEGEIVEAYLCEHLFPEIATDFDRLEGRTAQYDVGDIRATIPDVGSDVPIDVKAQTTYINDPRESFILEVDYLKNGQHRRGWFFDESKATEYYLFVWISDARADDLSTTDDIRTAKCLLVSRTRLQEYLRSEGYDQERIELTAEKIRSDGKTRYIDAGHDDFFYFLTDFLPERPLNIVMDYEVLDRLAVETYTVRPGTVQSGQHLFG